MAHMLPPGPSHTLPFGGVKLEEARPDAPVAAVDPDTHEDVVINLITRPWRKTSGESVQRSVQRGRRKNQQDAERL